MCIYLQIQTCCLAQSLYSTFLFIYAIIYKNVLLCLLFSGFSACLCIMNKSIISDLPIVSDVSFITFSGDLNV